MKKNKTAVIVVVVIILLILAAGAYKFMHHMQAVSQSGEGANSQARSQQMSTQKKSLFDFFSMVGSQKCTFSDSAGNSSGTVYVSSGKMRGDFTSAAQGKTTQSHMINDGSYIYYWTDGQQNGYKMSLEVIKQQESQVKESPSDGNSAPEPSQAVNMQQKSNYSCGPWSADSSLFTVPTNVTFTDYSSMMQGATTHSAASQGGSANSVKGSAAMCAECNQAPAGAARNQCLSALHCN